MGHDAQMQYRVLPVSEFANIGVYQMRKNNTLPTENITILHAGAVHGARKVHQCCALCVPHLLIIPNILTIHERNPVVIVLAAHGC